MGMCASDEMADEAGEERVEVVRGREREEYGGMKFCVDWGSSW